MGAPSTACADLAQTGGPVASLHDLSFADLECALVRDGVAPAHARALWRALYRGDAELLGKGENFSPPLQRWLERLVDFNSTGERLSVSSEVASSDGFTTKYLLQLADGQTIETVLMEYRKRFTVCVSTQVGCAMGCVFCATGQMGFVRHLRPGEIVAQVRHAQSELRARGSAGLRNLVLMGMGEPLHNYDAVMTALEIITDPRGIALAPRHVSISTVGVVPGILRLAEEGRAFNLAVSLHGATEAERSALVPASRRWPLAELIAACRTYGAQTGRRIFFEWTLIAGINDSAAQASRLAVLLAGMKAHVNLIPLNPTPGFAGTTTVPETAAVFQRVLMATGIPSTVRQRRGIDVAAGCGQLRAERTRRPG